MSFWEPFGVPNVQTLWGDYEVVYRHAVKPGMEVREFGDEWYAEQFLRTEVFSDLFNCQTMERLLRQELCTADLMNLDGRARIRMVARLLLSGQVAFVRIPRKTYETPLVAAERKPEPAPSDGRVAPIEVWAPRWEHVKAERKETDPGKARFGDEIRLQVSVSGVDEGAAVAFDVVDASEDPPRTLATRQGPNNGGKAAATWVVEGDEPPELPRIEFRGRVSKSTSVRAPVALRDYIRVRIPIDPEKASSRDDKFKLVVKSDPDTVEAEETRTVKDDLVEGDECVDLVFSQGLPDRLYSLEIDPGKEGDPYWMFEDTPADELTR